MVPLGIKVELFTFGASPSCKKVLLLCPLAPLKSACKKVLFNICCQDEVFLPDMLSSHSVKKVHMFLLNKDRNLSNFLSNCAQICQNYLTYHL